MSVLIISGGEYVPYTGPPCDLVIACDRGYLHAEKMGIRPDLILGDFDSSPAPDGSIPFEWFSAHKDDTDTMLAVKRSLESDHREITIACAFGGRLDHSFANIQAGAYAADRHAVVRLLGSDTKACIFRDRSVCFPEQTGWSLSVFSLSDSCTISITGTEYECSDLTFRNIYPIGISNRWVSDKACITGKDGILMVMESRM